MQRVVIIGSPGAGKSTLSRKLAHRTGLPLIHLDAEYWHSGWVESTSEEWRAKLDGLLARPGWVMDGNYGGSMDERLARADTAILLDYPTILCLWRVVKRLIAHRGRTRPDMAPGCPERFDWAFLLYVATFQRSRGRALVARLERFAGEVIRLRSPGDAQAFLDGLG